MGLCFHVQRLCTIVLSTVRDTYVATYLVMMLIEPPSLLLFFVARVSELLARGSLGSVGWAVSVAGFLFLCL